MALDLVTKAEYKAYAGIKSASQDDRITAIIPKISALVKTYCGRSFVDYLDDAKEEIFDGPAESFWLTEFPVVDVTSVEISTDYGASYTTLDEFTHYVLSKADGRLIPTPYMGSYWDSRLRGYKVTYTAGYQDLPADLKLAVLDLVTYYLKNDMSVHSPKAPGTNSVQIEYTSNSSLPGHISRVLDKYKATWY